LILCRKKPKISYSVPRSKRRPILKALRMARADAGLTISELAERAGVSRDTISNAEKGRHGLQATTLHKLAAALGKTPSELLAEEERLAPKAERRTSLELSLFNGLEEERLREWDAAVRSAHELREHGQENVGQLLGAWQESKDRGDDPAERRPYLDEIGELLQQAYDATTALWQALGGQLGRNQWPELQAADRFYVELWHLVQDAGLSIRTSASQGDDGVQEGRPEAVAESAAA
jgi:transcriptional regulator with XRE-family HTH domain